MFRQVQTILPLLIAFAVSAGLGPFVIPFLTKLKVGQTERKEGVQEHLKKAGTPTMGGIMFLIAFLAACAFFMGSYPKIVPVVILTLGFGIIGFLDDYLKVVLRRSDGLFPKQKMGLEIVVTTIFLVYIWVLDRSCLDIRIPFSGGFILQGTPLRIGATILAYFVIIGTVNGVNFTDGLDGLASSVTSVVCAFFISASLYLTGQVEPAGAAMLGALLGFLVHNTFKAKIFMGDTGSLALGGFVAGMAYMMKLPVYILLIGLIYLIEVLSVMIQVTYFKKTGGKRIFKMTPIHHHFELSGWSEPRIVAVFTIVTIFGCALASFGL